MVSYKSEKQIYIGLDKICTFEEAVSSIKQNSEPYQLQPVPGSIEVLAAKVRSVVQSATND